jgi:hypothetical protein
MMLSACPDIVDYAKDGIVNWRDFAMSENTGRAFEKLTFPLRDLIGVDIELLRQLGQRPLALDRGQGHFRLEGRCVVPTGALRHLIS